MKGEFVCICMPRQRHRYCSFKAYYRRRRKVLTAILMIGDTLLVVTLNVADSSGRRV